MTNSIEIWGKEIVTETISGIPYRIYKDRPRRIENLLAHADGWGERAHIVQGDRVLTFRGLHDAVAAKAAELAALNLAPQSRVFLLGWNSPEWVVNFWAILRAGAVPVLANGWWSAEELADALRRLTPALTLADAAGLRKMPAGAATAPWETPASPAPRNTRPEPIPDDENAPAVIIFTSGTEGRPKAVVLSHRSVLSGIHMILHITRRLPQQIGPDSGETALHTGPLFHIGGVQTLLRAVMVADRLVMPAGKFDAGVAIDLIATHRVARWSAVPTMVSRVLEHPDLAKRDLSSLKSLTVGGAPVHAELLTRIREGLPSVDARVPTGYGLTENGGQATAASGGDTAARPGSSGRPLPCVELRTLPPGDSAPDGEIQLRAPTQMLGFFDTAGSPIDGEGWLSTGDLGHLDADGHLWITGRAKDMIIRGGENIAPVAVESALMAIEGVNEVAVIGVPHPDLGEEVMAFVVLEADLSAEDLARALAGKVSSFAIPSRWHLQSDPLPTNHSGKIDKAGLARDMRARLAGAA
ncbi:class I adenylate-forming enzyme family protein [Gemmobacter sp.]|uniref:class I adenylate-forming enzyme family protein n=1 Tax=Gemmobacter sp. TaxID=1898957 RepID=UPI002AFEBA41|nr:class I adenylate-forming enzyme family protein [Gemmobacter sp.]